MPAINFPASPSINDTFTSSGKTWKWNGTFWELVVSGASVADGSVSTAKIADGAITAAKIADGTIVAAEIANNAITTDKIATGAVTAAKLGNDIQLTPPNGSITQAKLAASLSGITITTTANRDTDIASPFAGQFAFLTDTNAFIRWNGSTWVTAIVSTPTEAPTSLALVSATTTTATISFAAGADGGSAITNYQYALSTNSGASYGSYNALNPADASSPITITGLTVGTAYYIKLKAVNAQGASAVESNALSFSTIALTVDYLVVAGGGGAAVYYSGGGGAGGLRSTVTTTGGGGTLETALTLIPSTNYSVTVGAGGAGSSNSSSGGSAGAQGSNSVFSTITSTGGGGGGSRTAGISGGSGGGGGNASTSGGAGTLNQGFAGGSGNGTGGSSDIAAGGGGGAGQTGTSGVLNATRGVGGNGVAVSITGSSVTYAGGGGGGASGSLGSIRTSGGSGGGGAGGCGASGLYAGVAGTANTGGGAGGGGENPNTTGVAGGSGVVILRYPDAFTITIGAGLTGSTSTVGSNKVTTLTAGSGNVSWS